MPGQGYAPSLDPGAGGGVEVQAPPQGWDAVLQRLLLGDLSVLGEIDVAALVGNIDLAGILAQLPPERARRLLDAFRSVLPLPLIAILEAGLPFDESRYLGAVEVSSDSGQNVIVRDAPSTAGGVVASVASGTMLLLVSTATNDAGETWHEVEIFSTRARGYVRSDLAETGFDAAEAAQNAPEAPAPAQDRSARPDAGSTATSRGERRVRSGPSATETDILGVIPDGAQIQILDRMEVFSVDPATLPDVPDPSYPLWLLVSFEREGGETLEGWVAAIDASAEGGSEGYRGSAALDEIFLQGWAPGSGEGLYNQGASNAGQCVWYAYNRLREMGYDRRILDAIRGNGGQWDEAAIAQGGIEVGRPERGAIAVWEISNGSGGSAGSVGHVAVVEEAFPGDAEGTMVIVLSEYNWNSDEAYGMRVVREGEGDWPDHFVMLPRGSNDLGVWADWTEAWLEAKQLTGTSAEAGGEEVSGGALRAQ